MDVTDKEKVKKEEGIDETDETGKNEDVRKV